VSREERSGASIRVALIPSGWILLLVHAAMATGMVYMSQVAFTIRLPGLYAAALVCWVILAWVIWETMRRTITVIRRRGSSFVRGARVSKQEILDISVSEVASELTAYSVDLSLPTGNVSVAKSLSLQRARREAALIKKVVSGATR